MLESFFIVGTQVLILFILILIGFFCGKIRLLNHTGVSCINDLMLYVVNPCVIVNAFQRPFNGEDLKNFLLAALAAVIGHIISVFLGILIFRKQEESRRRVLRFATAFSNCGFMALPLLDALLGSDGVFYGAAYLAVFNMLTWTYGQYIMAKGSEGFSLRKVFLNPSIISVFVGLILFFSSVSLPVLIKSPVAYLAALNTPVPMIIIGFTISGLELKHIFRLGDEMVAVLLRLVASPLLLFGILYLIGFRGSLLTACIVSGSAPVAALTTMFSIKFGCDEHLSARLVASSTLLSIITMTLIVGLANYL